jgi:hypothetical protein
MRCFCGFRVGQDIRRVVKQAIDSQEDFGRPGRCFSSTLAAIFREARLGYFQRKTTGRGRFIVAPRASPIEGKDKMGNKYGHLDKHKFAHFAYENAKEHPTKHCARFITCRLKMPGSIVTKRVLYSKTRGLFNFPYPITARELETLSFGYRHGGPAPGFPKGLDHKYGHIQVYTGRSEHP